MKFFVLSDNKFLLTEFDRLLKQKKLYPGNEWRFACSPSNNFLLDDKGLPVKLEAFDIKARYQELLGYDTIFSLHCKQLFPAELVKKVRCINVHPGFNPYNRGWFPQVFSILNKMKGGATIHLIDEQLDHGPIIAQREVAIEKWDNSLSAYNKIQQEEVKLLDENLEKIISGNYIAAKPSTEGNVNLKKDFNALCKIDLEKKISMEEAIDYLRALTHGEYMNAWFKDPATGKKIFVKLSLYPEE